MCVCACMCFVVFWVFAFLFVICVFVCVSELFFLCLDVSGFVFGCFGFGRLCLVFCAFVFYFLGVGV